MTRQQMPYPKLSPKQQLRLHSYSHGLGCDALCDDVNTQCAAVCEG